MMKNLLGGFAAMVTGNVEKFIEKHSDPETRIAYKRETFEKEIDNKIEDVKSRIVTLDCSRAQAIKNMNSARERASNFGSPEDLKNQAKVAFAAGKESTAKALIRRAVAAEEIQVRNKSDLEKMGAILNKIDERKVRLEDAYQTLLVDKGTILGKFDLAAANNLASEVLIDNNTFAGIDDILSDIDQEIVKLDSETRLNDMAYDITSPAPASSSKVDREFEEMKKTLGL